MILGNIALTLTAAIVFCWAAKVSWSLLRWKAYIWVPRSIVSRKHAERTADNSKHLIFTMVDHYEPGYGERGVERNEAWVNAFRSISNSHRDSTGTCFRYSWFYPFDHRNEKILVSLCKMAYDGHGEVELHWHHPPANDETFPGMLREAIAWFQQYGALISSGAKPSTNFAFIHGNWGLDNSLPLCGVDHELQILSQHGCYADFTFSTIGTRAQPRKVNAIYYPRCLDGPKCYDDGIDVEVGRSAPDHPLIFLGPIHFNWLTGSLEYGAVESFALPSPARIERWIDTNIHVRGRPEWVFVKVYSHGAQSADEIVHKRLGPMLTDLERICQRRGITLHYMTAREAFNVVKAAEAGEAGNPAEFRDYKIPKPRNMLVHTEVPVTIVDRTDEDAVAYERMV